MTSSGTVFPTVGSINAPILPQVSTNSRKKWSEKSIGLASDNAKAIDIWLYLTRGEAHRRESLNAPFPPSDEVVGKMWSKVKNTLRSLEARTRESLLEAIGQALAGITPQDTLNWFAHCGYNLI
ncbi:MAG: hypothetical protein ACREDS_16310 [Limisphaerales bacterium]